MPELNAYVKSQEGLFEIQLAIRDSAWFFQLQEHDIRASDFRVEVETSGGRQVYQKGPCNTYKGLVNYDTLQKARLYISDNYLGGTFEREGELYFITPARFLLEPEEGQNLSLAYVLYKEKLTSDTLWCLSDAPLMEDTLGSDPLEFRDHYDCSVFNENWNNNSRFLELAIETDNEFLDFFKDANGEVEIEDANAAVIEKIMKIDGLYNHFNLNIILTFIHLWESSDIYSNTNDLEVMWNQVQGFWNNDFPHIQRDHVHFFSGKDSNPGMGIDGGTIFSGRRSVCGTHYDTQEDDDNGNYWAFSYTVSARERPSIYRTAAHEIGHAFGLGHICECTLMYSPGQSNCPIFCPSEEERLLNFSATSKRNFCSYINGYNDLYGWDNDACLQFIPPLDYEFNLVLEAEEVLIGEFSNVCEGAEIYAFFYNAFDNYQNLTWQYSANLIQLAAPAPNERTFQALSAGPAYVRITFDYQGQTLTYTRSFQVGPPTEPVGPPGIVQVPGSSPPQYDIIFYGVPYADYYRYQITLVGPLGNPISQEIGATDDLFPLITIPDDVCAQATIRPGNDCGLSTQAYYFEACPPSGANLAHHPSAEIIEATGKIRPQIDELLLFPNPANDVIRIFHSAPIRKIEVINAASERIYVATPAQAETHSISVGDWPSGAYFIRVTTEYSVLSRGFIVE